MSDAPAGTEARATTVSRPVAVDGIGLHTGARATLTLLPAAFGQGVVFHTPAGTVPATLHHATPGGGCTVLTRGPATVSTPEHLLAALSALGVTDVGLAIDGPEVPALDGSAVGWVEAIDRAGRVAGPALPAPPGLDGPVRVDAFDGWAEAGPGGPTLTVEVAFVDGPAGTLVVPLDEASFRAEVAWARTFVLARDVAALRAAGRGRGATADNTVVWPDAPLRSPDEPVRHKLLDAWGDLALLGRWSAAVRVVRGGHGLHQALAREIARGYSGNRSAR
ncbi:MAG: UDP-3-O-acyl-N-acetylglucosamine deacetylase [Myxococcota bacterium]